MLFFFNDTATTEIYTLSLHDALPIWFAVSRATPSRWRHCGRSTSTSSRGSTCCLGGLMSPLIVLHSVVAAAARSEEHTSELQSRQYLVCRLLLEKKKKNLHKQQSLIN